MQNKKILFANTRILTPNSGFIHKLLCDGPTLSHSSSCHFTCAYCYVPSMMQRGGSEVDKLLKASGEWFQDVVIKRLTPLSRLRQDLDELPAKMKNAPLVAYLSPCCDVAATDELALETADLCSELMVKTNWHMRALSKSNKIILIAQNIPSKWKNRMIYGLSTGTLVDNIARAIEPDAPAPSERLAALAQLQAQGYRTFGMLCPILPQTDPVAYAQKASTLINFEKCEHVWAEVLNRRGRSMELTAEALETAGLDELAERLRRVYGNGSTPAWETYARSTFDALTTVLPGTKLRFLQYVTKKSCDYWRHQEHLGAIPLGHASVGTKTDHDG